MISAPVVVLCNQYLIVYYFLQDKSNTMRGLPALSSFSVFELHAISQMTVTMPETSIASGSIAQKETGEVVCQTTNDLPGV